MLIITGANGFIGSAMLWECNQRGLPVLAVVDPISIKERSQLLANKKYGQFLDKNQLWDFLSQPSTIEKVTWIIHMGAISSTTETNADLLWENNTQYTQKIFEWCATHKKNLIYASSAATYGAGELGYDDFIDHENLKPLNLYGESKVRFDRWAVKQTAQPPHWYGLKFFNVYGPNEYFKGPMASLVFKSYQQIQTTGEISLFKSHKSGYKDGEQMRDFVYVKDVTGWMNELMEKTPKSGIYNMGFGEARTWNALATAAFNAIEKPVNIRYVDMPENIRDQYQYYTKANMETWMSIGMSAPQWSLENGVKDYVQNHLKKENAVL
jgi:ADP-L-glycero-D-manno-heptose 6-epimerase